MLQSRSVVAALVASLMLSACGGDDGPKDPIGQQDLNVAPVVTITSPTSGATVREDGPKYTLTASAADAEDGDLTAAIAWTSSKDGALTRDAEGKVALSIGTHTLTASATDSKGKKGSASVDVTVTALPSATHVVAEGLKLHLYAVTADELIERGVAELPATGLLGGHQIFGVIQHPTQPWLYASSLNECYGEAWCWGNSRIDRFVVSGTSITYAGPAFVSDATMTSMSCTQQDWGYTGQLGACAPVSLAFNADGSRLFVQDDYDDAVQTFSIDAATGAASYLNVGAPTDLHGIAVHPDGQYMYHGSAVFSVTGDSTVALRPGAAGNATQVVNVAGAPLLLTTVDTEGLAMHSLTDPAAPVELSTLSIGEKAARDVAINKAGTRLLTAGRNSVSTVAFNGSVLTLEQSLALTGDVSVENRGVAFASNDTQAVVVWFKADRTTGARTGGATVYGLGAAGELTALNTLDYAGGARVILPVRLP